MSWNVVLSDEALEDLEKIEEKLAQRVFSKVDEIKQNVGKGVDPEHYFKYINKFEVYRLRVGHYRVFTDIDRNMKNLEVLTVLPRDKAYRGWG